MRNSISAITRISSSPARCASFTASSLLGWFLPFLILLKFPVAIPNTFAIMRSRWVGLRVFLQGQVVR